MKEVLFMNIVGIALLIYLIAYFIHQKMAKKLPGTSFTGFKNFNEIFDIFKKSLLILKNNTWLFVLPFIFILANCFYKITVWIYYYLKYPCVLNSAFRTSQSINVLSVMVKSLGAVIKAPLYLDYGFSGFIAGNFLFFLGIIGYLLIYKIVHKKILKFVDVKNKIDVDSFSRQMKYSLFAILFFIVLVILNIKIKSNTILLLTTTGIMIVLSFSGLLLFSILEAAILLSLNGIFENKIYSLKEVLSDSFSVFKKLFVFKVLLVLITYIFSLSEFGQTIQYLLTGIPPVSFKLLDSIKKVSSSFLMPLLSVIILMTPFIITTEKLDFLKSIKKTIVFIKIFLLKYLTMIMICTAFLAIPIYISSFFYSTFGTIGLSNWSISFQMLDIIVSIALLFISIISYISIFYFYYKNKEEINLYKK